MAYYSKYTGAELEERLDKVEEIPQLIAQMITGKDFVTKEDLLCVLKDYAPADYRTIPIDNNTIYWENGVLKAATSEGGQCQWELREHNGIQYLYSRLPVVTQYDVTMYADVNHLDLPSIYDGLPIDGDTIYWEETEDGKVLKAKSVGGSGESIDAGWVISVISNAGFATQNWVNNQNFISSSLLYSELAKYVKIKDYQEIEGVKNFLNGLQIAGLPITKLNGYEDVIYIDANVVVRGGLTMYYEDGEIDLPSIKDEIGNAGYDGVAGLASFNSSQFSISSDGTVTIIGGSTGLDKAQLKDYLDSNKYTTETWVKEQGYASASSLSSLQTKVNNFLEGSDTDTVINKWKELETFLSGLTESDNLATILTGKADKSYVDTNFVTIAGTEDVTGLHNFVNGLKIGGLPITKKQDDVVYLDANLVVRGGITMYAENEEDIPSILDSLPIASTSSAGIASFDSTYFSVDSNGMVSLTSAPSSGASTLGELLNVDASIDATASVDRVLYQPAGSATWTWRELPKDGIVGYYLPLTGGSLSGMLTVATELTGITINNTKTGRTPHITFQTKGTEVGALGISTSNVPQMYNASKGTWHTILTDDNYSSYALPLSGGTLNGDLCLKNEKYIKVYDTNGNSLIAFHMSGGNNLHVGHDTAIKGYNTYISGKTIYLQTYENAFNIAMSINSNGKVGIGTTSPAYKLDVNGTIRFASKTIWGQSFDGTANVSGGLSSVGKITYTNASERTMLSITNGNYPFSMVYKGNQTKLYNVDFIGTWGSQNSISFGCGGGGNTVDAQTSWMTIVKGNVGVGTTAPSQKLHVAGNILTTGGITMYSDIRKKTKLQDVELSLSQISNAPLIEHYYNSDQDKTTHVGSIAQYWAELNDWFCKLDNEGFYTMEIQNCALASAISIARHLEKYESKTDKTIRKMKQRIEELEDEVERLKNN